MTTRGEATRERILVAASDLFARNGYTGTSVESIAMSASITVPGMYRHFPSKEKLLLEVARRITRISEARRNLGTSSDLPGAVGELFAEYLAVGEETRRRLSIEMSRAAAMSSSLGRGLEEFNRLLRRSFERTISAVPEMADADPIEIEMLAHLVLVLLMGAIHLDTLDPGRVGDRVLSDHIVTVIRRLLEGEVPDGPARTVPAVESIREVRPGAIDRETDGRRRRGLRTRQRIVAAAAELFAFEGYDTTTTDRIAERAGISVPGLYGHFESKRDLLVEVARTTYDGYRLMDVTGGGHEVAAHLAELAVAFSSSGDHLSRRLSIELDFGAWRDPGLAETLRNFHRRVRRNVGAALAGGGAPDARADDSALVYLMLFMGIAHLDTVDPGLVDDERWADLLRRRVSQILSPVTVEVRQA